jgi:hypothetical protein
MTSPDLDIHIEELVLHGFDGPLASPGQAINRARIGAVVQSELARLFAERGIPRSLSRGGQVTSLDGGALDIAPGSGAEAIGGHIAEALYQGFSQ